MLHIIVMILKFIGIALAAILALVVLLLCIVLFVPARYKLEVACDGTKEGTEAHAKVSWFFHLVSGAVDYKENKTAWQVRILWKKLNQEKKPKKRRVKKKEKLKSPEPKSSEPEKTVEEEEAKAPEKQGKQREHKRQERHSMSTTPKRDEKKNVFRKIKYTFQTICAKITVLLEKKERLTEFLTDTVHRSAFARVWQETLRLARFLRPKRIKMNIRFGFEDPYHTGCALALLSMSDPFTERISV